MPGYMLMRVLILSGFAQTSYSKENTKPACRSKASGVEKRVSEKSQGKAVVAPKKVVQAR